MYRLTLYVDTQAVDLVLPGDIPVAVLVPAVSDLLHQQGLALPTPAACIASVGRGPLHPELTLAENGIHDGTVLTMVAPRRPAAVDPVIDAAAAIAATRPAVPWLQHPAVARRMGLAIATGLAGVTGFLVVPDGPGLAHLLLAAAAVSVLAVVSARVAGDSRGGASATACLALLCTAAALTAVVCGRSVADAGVILAVSSVSLLTVSGRVVVRVLGLYGDDQQLSGDRAGTASALMNAVVSAAAVGAALGVLAAAGVGAASWPRCAFAAAVAAVLLIRVRIYPDPLPSGSLLIGGIFCIAMVLVILDRQLVSLTWGVCLAAAAIGAAAVWLGAHPPTMSPGSERVLTACEHILLVALLPLACWSLDLFGPLR
ncbi:hypothetical protein BH11ACT7_BH11ACT7_17060 [soil metagenome]